MKEEIMPLISHKEIPLENKRKEVQKPQILLFILNLLIILPFWVSFLLPVTIIYFLLEKLFTMCCKKKAIKQKENELIPRSNYKKEFDLVVYGSTGFTGNFVCSYLAQNYTYSAEMKSTGKNLKWAIAGRNHKKLLNLKENLIKQNFDLKNLEIVIADSNDIKAVQDMVARTRVIINTAGPFSLYAENIIASCVEYNTDYCDITGEVDWVRQMIVKYQLKASQNGSRIVFCAGADSIPWDLATLKLNDKMIEKNEKLIKVEHINEGKAKFSGGSLKTILLKIDGERISNVKNIGFDPLRADSNKQNNDELEERTFKTKINLPKLFYKKLNKWCGFSVIGLGNSRVVLRSNSIIQYHENFEYKESWASKYFINLFNQQFLLLVLGTCILLRPLRWLMFKTGLLPSPGSGPSEEYMTTNYLIIDSIGTGSNGSEVSMQTIYNEDIAYIDTARMLVESGLCFVFESEKCIKRGGLFTPAIAFGNLLYTRLENSGTQFINAE